MKILNTYIDAALVIEKLRVASEVRQTHIFLNGLKVLKDEGVITEEMMEIYKKNWKKRRSTTGIPQEKRLHDPETDKLHTEIKNLEDFVDGRVAELIKGHPAYPWFSQVKGIGRENIGKVIGLIRIKLDPEHPPKNVNNPNWADTISALNKFAGFAPDPEGKAMKRVKGEKIHYNSQLRSMCWRLATSLKKAKGKFYDYYLKEKEKYTERFTQEGKRILPTPTGKWGCLNCGASWEKKGEIVSCCNDPQIEKTVREEPPGVIYKGHLDMMAMRKMIKLFLACLWLYWRKAEGLSVSNPYPIDRLGHAKVISPEEMIDRKPYRAK